MKYSEKPTDVGDDATEATSLLDKPNKLQQYCVIGCVCMIKFGDTVELYLPGVVNQDVSCELDIGSYEEGILGIAIYVGAMVASFFAGPVSIQLGRKRTLLVALYSCLLATVLCAVVPNYRTLLLCRVLVGWSAGLSLGTGGVYLGETVADKSLYTTGIFLTSISCAAGAGWIGILGYWFLERLGWRWFMLCTSIPIFVIPILLLHSYLPESPYFNKITSPTKQPNKAGIKLITFKFSLVGFITLFYGYGSILLLPSLIQSDNVKRGVHADIPGNCNAVFGIQFLVLAMVSGLCNILGRVLGYFSHGKVSFRVLVMSAGSVSTLCYGGMLLSSNILNLEVLIGLAKLMSAAVSNELTICAYNPRILGYETYATSCTIIIGFCYLGAVCGTALAVFSPNIVSLVLCFVLCFLNVLLTYTVNEV